MNRSVLYYFEVLMIWLLYMPFVASTYIIVWLDRKLKFPLSFPRDIEQLNKQQHWCIAQLKRNGILPNDAKIISYLVNPLNPDLIFRSNAGVIEIKYTSGNLSQELKCFAKFAPTQGSAWNRTIFNLQLNHLKETWFNRYFVKDNGVIPSPKVFYTNMSLATGNLCLITELMSGCREYNGINDDDFEAIHLDLVLTGLATLHSAYWKSDSLLMKRVLPIEDATVDFFDSIVASGWSLNARNIMMTSWKKMNERETVLHGDARLGNMMFPKSAGEGRFVFIDWQAVRQGKAAYDLAYFLVLSLWPNHRQRVEAECIEKYHQLLGKRDYTKEELLEDYNHACLCVLVLLSLPLLSGEASVEGYGAKVFAWGMNIWKERMQVKFSEFDYAWMANRYQISEDEGRKAVEEMLDVIKNRLERIVASTA